MNIKHINEPQKNSKKWNRILNQLQNQTPKESKL